MLDMATVKHLIESITSHNDFVEVREYSLTQPTIPVSITKLAKSPIVKWVDDKLVIISPAINRTIAPHEIWAYGAQSIGVLSLIVDDMKTCITLHTDTGKDRTPLQICL